MSMGTTVNLSDSECVSLANGILATPFSVLWSLQDVYLHELVRRVAGHQNEHKFFLSDWIPQQAAARHKSVAITILHGGAGGVAQCLYNGIPEIVIPSALAARAVSGGAGLRMYRHEITAQKGWLKP